MCFVFLVFNCRIKNSSGEEDFQDALLEEIITSILQGFSEYWNIINPWCKILRQAGGNKHCSNDSVNNSDLN